MVLLRKKTMKNFHFCISGGDEILFRREEDYIRGFNTLALAVAETGAFLNAEAFMSTHLHVCLRTDDVNAFIYRFWRSYTRYFNSRYGRTGTLGGRPCIVEIEGFHHWMTAVCYVLRNPVHHGVAPTPFAYRHSSANAIFRKETGKGMQGELLPSKSYYKYLPKGTKCPQGYLMDSSGLILRETVLDLSDIEHRFATPRSFLFYMNRLSSEEWKREQNDDNVDAVPITLELIERNVSSHSLSEMLKYEHGHSNYKDMTDTELCTYVDQTVLPSCGRSSVYELSQQEKNRILKLVCADIMVSERRVRRCLLM